MRSDPSPHDYHFTTTFFPAISCPIWRLVGDLGCLILFPYIFCPYGTPNTTEFTFTITCVAHMEQPWSVLRAFCEEANGFHLIRGAHLLA
jgi:hypothetical protein